jgi:hypothetical protein
VNIIQASRLLADGKIIRRKAWSNDHNGIGIMAQIPGPSAEFLVYVVGLDFAKRVWSPSVNDLTADDWFET